MLASLIAALVRFCTRHALAVVLLALAAGAGAGWYTAGHFAMDTNSEDLVSANAPWRINEARYDQRFPEQNNLILAVVDGATAERANEAAGALTAALTPDTKLFTLVRRPDSGPFFRRDGLLLLPKAQVAGTMQSLIQAQPFLGGLAADPSLRGVVTTLGTLLQGVQAGQTNLDKLDKPLTAFGATLAGALAGRPAYFGWSAMINDGAPGDLSPVRAFVEIKPVLDYSSLTPGDAAASEIRRVAASLHLDASTGVRVRLTGPVPMSDEEFATIAQNGLLIAGVMGGMVLLMLWLALWSTRMILAILITMIVGLSLTASVGLIVYQSFNVISVAFIQLFVGLGVDFGIQYCVRYRAERHRIQGLSAALAAAGRGIGGGLTLAALAAAAGFFSFLPTDYAGVKELGLIAGSGMAITYVLSLTLLPALLQLFKPRGERSDVGWSALAPLDAYLASRSRQVLLFALGAAALGGALMPFLRFDSNPLDLRNPRTESVATALDLMKNPQTSPNTINILRPTRAAAAALAGQLSKLPEVSQVLSVETFLPDDQDAKIAIIKDASNILEPTLSPAFPAPPADEASTIAALGATALALDEAAAQDKSSARARDDARALSVTLKALAKAPEARRIAAENAFVPGLRTLLAQLRDALNPFPVDFKTLPAEVKRDWISPDGAFRVQVFPSGNANDDRVLNRFTQAVLAAAPDATGTPIIIMESGKTIVGAFLKAGLYSFLSIALILLIALRRLRDTLVALAPLVLAGVMTLATCVALGIALNFANIIALPLLFGVGVAFDIYFIMAWRAGQRDLLRSPLTRAVVMSAATTATAFGTLSLSSHPGTASMGLILMISLAWILATMLIVLPALLNWLLPRAGLPKPAAGA